jgi:hypothetical protein
MKTVEISVYLSGPMYGTYEESTSWRIDVKNALYEAEKNQGTRFLWNNKEEIFKFHYNILDPCTRWFDSKKYLDDNASWIVQLDKMEINKANVIIVNASDHGWGTPQEQYLAYEYDNKMIITFIGNREYPPIWAKQHSHVVTKTHLDAAEWLVAHSIHIGRTL